LPRRRGGGLPQEQDDCRKDRGGLMQKRHRRMVSVPCAGCQVPGAVPCAACLVRCQVWVPGTGHQAPGTAPGTRHRAPGTGARFRSLRRQSARAGACR
jgi:hypothetical protein